MEHKILSRSNFGEKQIYSSGTRFLFVMSAMIHFCILSPVTCQEVESTTSSSAILYPRISEIDVSVHPTSAFISNSDVSKYQSSLNSHTWNVTCQSKVCFFRLNSTLNNVMQSIKNVESIFQAYVEEKSNFITQRGLERLLTNLRIIENNKVLHADEKIHNNDPDDEDHDNEDHNPEDQDDEEHDGEDHDDRTQALRAYLDPTFKCIKNIGDLQQEYFPNLEPSEIEISFSDLYLLIPHLVRDLQNSNCRYENSKDTENLMNHKNHDHGDNEEEMEVDRAKVWGIALVSVAIISLLSIVGILTVPLMGYSRSFKILLSFLVALAVGTMVGDALLHLLPHALGSHDHHHDHDRENSAKDEAEKMLILKSLVAVFGVYVFFLFESGMSIIRKRKRKQRCRSSAGSSPKMEAVDSPLKSEDFLMVTKQMTDGDSLLHQSDNSSSNKTDEETCRSADSGIVSSAIFASKLPSTSSSSSLKPFCDPFENKTQTFSIKIKNNNDHKDEESLTSLEKNEDHDHDHHHHHHHGDIANVQGIKDLAWMIIAGDGLHNFSDGLAIGAAFSSTISAGLSTSLAIFFHELPHELGDFAILIDAGMSIKKALAYNGLCACLAFFGAIIGLLIGEHTETVKLWILAITAGGFLYVALVDMLPQMLRQCVEKDAGRRFIVQNIGFLCGVMTMLLIAWYEDSFSHIFNVVQDH